MATITVPDSVTRIGNIAFDGTKWLANQANGVVYAGKVAYFAKGTLSGTLSLKSGTLAIADCAFENQTKLTNVTIPASIQRIGESAFERCTGLTKAIINNGVGIIGGSAFADCAKLTSIKITVK